jgi:hypothetical protein
VLEENDQDQLGELLARAFDKNPLLRGDAEQRPGRNEADRTNSWVKSG